MHCNDPACDAACLTQVIKKPNKDSLFNAMKNVWGAGIE